MDNLVSVTDARNNFSALINEVIKERKRFVLLRKSQPQAVIIPYEGLVETDEDWQNEFKKLISETRPSFKRWLGKQGIKTKDLTEEKLYELLDKVTGRD